MRLISIPQSAIKPGDRVRAIETFAGGSTITHEGVVENREVKYVDDPQGQWRVEYIDIVGIPRYEYTADQLRAVRGVEWFLMKDDLPEVVGAVIRIGTRAAVYDGAMWGWSNDDPGYPADEDLSDAEVLFVPGKLA